MGLFGQKEWVVERKGPRDDFEGRDSGYGGFLYTIIWMYHFIGEAGESGVWVQATADLHRFSHTHLGKSAMVEYECDQETGDIKEKKKRSGGTENNGDMSVSADLVSELDGKTAKVAYAAGAAWAGSTSISVSGGFVTVNVTDTSSGESGKGTATYECVCKDE